MLKHLDDSLAGRGPHCHAAVVQVEEPVRRHEMAQHTGLQAKGGVAFRVTATQTARYTGTRLSNGRLCVKRSFAALCAPQHAQNWAHRSVRIALALLQAYTPEAGVDGSPLASGSRQVVHALAFWCLRRCDSNSRLLRIASSCQHRWVCRLSLLQQSGCALEQACSGR